MDSGSLKSFLTEKGARFGTLSGREVVAAYGDKWAEHDALTTSAGVLDLSFRSRVCVVGADRARFLHGQVTNEVKSLKAGQGCYAALTTAKGKMESDLNIFCLPDELLLDFEPGLTEKVIRRLEKYIVADDVQVVDVAPLYGLWSVQGPRAEALVLGLDLAPSLPPGELGSIKINHSGLGEIYVARHSRLNSVGFDLFIPAAMMVPVGDRLWAAAQTCGARFCGWDAFEMARIEAGVPRYGVDMDESNFPQEAGIEARAVSYAKGCYIGQEVLNRIHTMGQVTRQLRALRLADDLPEPPVRGDKLFHDGKEVGCITSAVKSPRLGANIALGYVRKEANQVGTELAWQTPRGSSSARVVQLPFSFDRP